MPATFMVVPTAFVKSDTGIKSIAGTISGEVPIAFTVYATQLLLLAEMVKLIFDQIVPFVKLDEQLLEKSVFEFLLNLIVLLTRVAHHVQELS